jgi:nucleotide-binding universal stress UspA family protein
MKTILVATDFSSSATNAVNYAADMAVSLNAKLILFHVYQVPVIYSEVPVAVNEADMITAAEKDMASLGSEINKKRNDKLHIETEVKMGVFFYELKSLCDTIKPYLVVLGSQGTTATERFLFGSHTVYAMKHLKWPLMTVPPESHFASIKKIGLACDFNNVIDTTPIEDIKILVKDFNAELHVINTGKETVFDPDIVFESGLLQEMLEGLDPKYDFVSSDNMDEGIIDFAEKNKIDLLVILPKRHDLLEKLTKKSHTKKLVLHSHVPVMALHQQSNQ